MIDVLSRRGLNRATLARQFLLERVPARPIEVIERLGGMQSQAPLAPYVGLWTRLRRFAPQELSALTEERQVVRLHLMRNTLHLVSARDALDWPEFFRPLHAGMFGAHFRRGAERVDREALLGQARQLLAERPRTRAELGRLLAPHWPDADPSALGYAATHHIVLCQPVLYDLPEAPRPDEDVPAAPRFLPEYDNLLLSYRDRTRVILDNRPVPLLPGNGATGGTLLIDGMWQGVWRVRGRTLRLQPFTELRHADRDALLAEAELLCAFIAPQAKYDVVLDKP